MARYRHAYSRETTLAEVADTFRESIMNTQVLRMTIYTYGNWKWGLIGHTSTKEG